MMSKERGKQTIKLVKQPLATSNSCRSRIYIDFSSDDGNENHEYHGKSICSRV